MVEKEKKAFAAAVAAEEGTPSKRKGNTTDRSNGSGSPLRIKGNLERKFSEGNFAASPVKRKMVLAEFTPSGRREIADAGFYNAQITTLNNVIVSQTSKLAVI